MFVRFLLVFDLLFILFSIALWPSAGKELSLCCFNFSVVVVVHYDTSLSVVNLNMKIPTAV